MLQRSAGVALFLCGVLAGCGGGDRTPPGAPATASPSPPPIASSSGYLHVLQHSLVMTYHIDSTGRLQPPVAQDLGQDLYALAGEPQGRFVYAGRGGSPQANGQNVSDLTLVTYAPDPRDGTLAEMSTTTVLPRAQSGFVGWLWVRGGANRVHALRVRRWGTALRHGTITYLTAAVASDGRLGPVSEKEFETDSDYGYVLADSRSDVLYKGGDTYRRGGLEAHVIEPDGTLSRMGWTNLCLASAMSQYNPGIPLVAARGFLFANLQDYEHPPALCSYQGLRLKPLYALDLNATTADAFVPSSEDEPALLAMNVRIPTGRGPTRSELRLFAMNRDGDLRPLAREDLQSEIAQLQFHPTSRFLYAVDSASALRVYTVDSEGRLELTMNIDQAGGAMAITLKDVRAADR